MCKIREGQFEFDFSQCGGAEKFDAQSCAGLKLVDFFVKADECVYFIEAKDFAHPRATDENRESDSRKLADNEDARFKQFPMEMGMKLKDSVLKCYASGGAAYELFQKQAIFLLFIHCPEFEPNERRNLYERINNGYVPTGLNDKKYTGFKCIAFDMPDVGKLEEKYSIKVTKIQLD